MAAWGVEIAEQDLREGVPDAEISLAVGLTFYFTKGEIGNLSYLNKLKDVDEIDRMLLPENFEEWRSELLTMVGEVMAGELPPSAEINGERVEEFPTRVG